MISSPIWLSRLPVGSSASRSRGSPTMARAIATRCCWPPESCGGKVVGARGEPDAVERRQRRLAPLAARHAAGRGAGSRRCPATVRSGTRWKLWKTKPIFSLRSARQLAVAVARRSAAPSRLTVPAGRRVEQAHQVEERALAAPRGTHDRDEFALLDVDVDAVERRGLDAVGAVDLADLFQADHRNLLQRSRIVSTCS